MDEPVEGRARVSGFEILAPTPRQVGVARSYIEGLERDRQKLHSMEQNVNETIWEMIQLSSYSRALYIALFHLLSAVENDRVTPELQMRVSDLLEADAKTYDEIWSCRCGHSKFDHDEHGCQYIGCRPICG